MPARRRLAAAFAVLAVGVAPSAALAQSGGAGNDQYVDPIGGNTQQKHHSSGSKGTSTGPALSATPTLSASSTSQSAAATPATTSAASAQTLPRTGFDVGPIAGIGLVLMLAGAALRVRLRPRDERL